MGRGWVLLAISIALLLLRSTSSSQVTGNAPASPESPRIKNVSPDEVRKRVTHSVLPVYPELAKQTHITGSVEIGLGTSSSGDVANYRVLVGAPLLTNAAVDAIRQWKFRPNVVQGEPTWSRTRALVRFNADGTRPIAFAHPLLADSFGDPGAQRNKPLKAAIPPIVVGVPPKPDEEIVFHSLRDAYTAAGALTLQDIPSLEKAAESGDARKQTLLGVAYRVGAGVPRDDVKAFYWLRKAVDQGLAVAQTFLGLIYSQGNGVVQDQAKALKWLRMAAEQDFPDAFVLLGTMYENGQGVPMDCAGAARWYRKAAEQGFANGQRYLGDMYANGQGVSQDLTEAVNWYRRAAQQGDTEAQTKLEALEKAVTQLTPARSVSDSEPDPGWLCHNVYTNQFFGFRYQFPQDWSIADRPLMEGISEQEEEAMKKRFFGDKPIPPNVTIQPFKGSVLLVATKLPLRSTPGVGPHIRLWWEEQPFVRTPEDYFLNSPQMNAPNAEVIGNPTKLTIGGREFLRTDRRFKSDESWTYLARVATIEKKYILAFDFAAESPEELAQLTKTLDTLAFQAPPNK
jgi:TonB family protein